MDHRGIHWRALATLDLPALEAIAAVVHPGFPEDIGVLAERQRLYPEGARLLELGGFPAGYIISHPWRLKSLPALNERLDALPRDPSTYYLHDLALLNKARGTGAAAMIVGDIIAHARAKSFGTISLVAVNNSQPFWHKHGFRVMDVPDLVDKLASYEVTARFMVKHLM